MNEPQQSERRQDPEMRRLVDQMLADIERQKNGSTDSVLSSVRTSHAARVRTPAPHCDRRFN